MKSAYHATVTVMVAVMLSPGEHRADAQKIPDKDTKVPLVYQEHIYLIKAKLGKTGMVELTGFKVMGEDGIYTSLHGVIGATEDEGIVALDKDFSRKSMKIAKVDVDRDIALLVPKEGSLRRGGLALGKPRTAIDLAQDDKVKLYGFPLRINQIVSSTNLSFKDPIREVLSKVVDDKARAALNTRNSPLTSVPVLYLQGPMMPGHSGSPIIDKDGAVIGVACGGLKEGQAHIGWAIPFHDIQLVECDKETTRLDRLAKIAVSSAYFCVLDEDARTNAQNFGVVSRTLIVSDDGDPVPALKMTPKEKLHELLKGAEKGDPLAQAKIMLGIFDNRLAPNTLVEVIETEKKEDAKKKEDGKKLELPKMPIKLPPESEAILKMIADQAFNQIEETWIRVKVLDGPRNGDTFWVLRKNLRSETVVIQRKGND